MFQGSHGGGSLAPAGGVRAEVLPVPPQRPAQAPGLAAGGGGAGQEAAGEVGGGSGTPLGSPIIWEHWGPTSVFCVPLLNSNFQAEPGLMPKKPSQRRRLRKRQSSSLREESELTRRRWVRRLVLGLQGEIRI